MGFSAMRFKGIEPNSDETHTGINENVSSGYAHKTVRSQGKVWLAEQNNSGNAAASTEDALEHERRSTPMQHESKANE